MISGPHGGWLSLRVDPGLPDRVCHVMWISSVGACVKL